MKFLGRLPLWQKFAILGLLAAITAAVPFSLFWQAQQQAFEATTKERAGLEPTLLALKVLQFNQQHRGLSANVLAGRTEMAQQRSDKQAELELTFAAADNKYRDYLKDARLLAHWDEIKREWRAIASGVGNKTFTVPESFTRHTQQSAELLAFVEELGGYSNMQLDPNPENFALIQSTLRALPALTEFLGQARAKGSGILSVSQATQTASPVADRVALSSILGGVKEYSGISKRRLDALYEISPQLRAQMESQTTLALSEAQRVYDLSQKDVIGPEMPTLPGPEYFRQYTIAIDAVFKSIEVSALQLDAQLIAQIELARSTLLRTTSIVAVLTLIAALLGVLISRGITMPVKTLVDTMIKIAQGDRRARVRPTNTDELGLLARQFDTMVDEREAVNERLEKENETLNNSIVTVLQAVFELSKRDLTIKVPVNEDVTGPVADAINALSDETAKVLSGVSMISSQVAMASNAVKAQSDAVMAVAANERVQVDESASRMAVAAREMNAIAVLARNSQIAGDAAIKTTQDALRTVTATVLGINATRDTIRETEKRIKRLGERSQEISGVVSLINSIAERTHILALNASMHAASAGEAGRGFAVVADEVQRLAENAREATTQISTLVSSIQSETQDTVSTMNAAITQVVEGSRLAEEAGRQMQATQDTTAELVKSVEQISVSSIKQAKITNELQEYAKQIKESTAQTSQQLTEQGEQTRSLVEFAGKLVQSVGVFKLPTPRRAA